MSGTFHGNLVRDDASTASWFSRGASEPALEPGLPIIDAHHHLWDLRKPAVRYLLDDFQSDLHSGHRIVSTVFVEGGAMYCASGPDPMKPLGEVEFAAGAAAMAASGLYGETQVAQAIVSHADLRLGSAVREVLEAQLRAAGGRLRGVRHYSVHDAGEVGRYIARPSPAHLLTDPVFQQGAQQLQALGLSFDAWVYHTQLEDVIALARAFPDLAIVLDHIGTPIGVADYAAHADAVRQHWRKSMAVLATLDNVAVKIGGMGMPVCGHDLHALPAPPGSETLATTWRPWIETCIELFGAHRCMFESNFPVDRQSCGYSELWNAFKRVTRSFSDSERRDLFSGCAARLYRIPAPGDSPGTS